MQQEYKPQMFPSQKPAPNHALSELTSAVRGSVGDDFEIKLSQDMNITIIVKDGELSFQLTPYTDTTTAPMDNSKLYSLWNGTVTRNNTDQNCGRELDSKVHSVSLKMLLDWVKTHLSNITQPNYVRHADAKAVEPITRTEADAEIKSDDDIDKAIAELKRELGDGSMPEGGDQMKDAPETEKNVVDTFPTGEELTLGEKTPKKTNVSKTTFKDSKVKMNEVKLALNEQGDVVSVPKDAVTTPFQKRPTDIRVDYNPMNDDMKTLFQRRAGISKK